METPSSLSWPHFLPGGDECERVEIRGCEHHLCVAPTGLAFFLWPDHTLPGVANLCRARGADALTALNLSPVVRCSTALDTRARCEAIGDECVRNFVRAKESLALRKAAGDEKTGAMRETRARRLGEFLTDTIEVEVYDWRGK